MKLTFVRPHKSITSFPNIEVPDFTLITGVNGVGKTHFLEAILNGSIATDVLNHHPRESDIRYFDWTSLQPMHSPPTRPRRADFIPSHVQKFEQYLAAAQPIRQRLISSAHEAGLPEEYAENLGWLIESNEAQITAVVGDEATAQRIASAIQHASGPVVTSILAPYHGVAGVARRHVLMLEERDFGATSLAEVGRSDVFGQSFAALFDTYRTLAYENTHQQFRKSLGLKDAHPLTDEEFLATYHKPPWEFVNETLRASEMPFEIVPPDPDPKVAYVPTLQKVSTNIAVPFNSLSSGEKILMSFAFYIYQSQNPYETPEQLASARPRILLLDEIDAPLHPQMTRALLQIMQRTIVADHGVRVLATTHAPTTIALAPHESIYVMVPDLPGLHRASKATALNALTVGVPTISMSFDGRRQVFVESPADALIYQASFVALRSRLATERTLEFISTGTKGHAGTHVNTGCNIVRHIVSELGANRAIFGLIDWDGSNEPDDRVHVLAHARRNGLENVLFDPLLLTALLIRERLHLTEIGVGTDVGLAAFVSRGAAEMQSIVDVVQRRLLGSASEDLVDVQYVGGFSLRIAAEVLKMDDHALKELVLEKFPNIRRFEQRDGGAMAHIGQTVLLDAPALAPTELFDAFNALLSVENHADQTTSCPHPSA